MYTVNLDGTIILQSGGTTLSIPPNVENRDYRKYLRWLDEGNTPEYEQEEDPEVEKDKAANSRLAQPENRVIFKAMLKLENRVRALEGEPPATVEDYVTLAKASYFEEIS